MKAHIFVKQLIWIAVVGASVVGAELAFIGLTTTRITQLIGRIGQHSASIAERERAQQEVAALQHDYDRVIPIMTRLDGVLPKPDDLFGLLAELDRLAKRTGNRITISVDSASPLDSEFPSIRYVAFSGEMAGSLVTFKQYMGELDRAPFFARIESFIVSAPSSLSSDALARITGRIFLK